MDEARQYPNHVCACMDRDLSRADHPILTDDGRKVMVTCGHGHRRVIPRWRWETELQRREEENRRHA
jgi:hypothetical protein